MQVINLSPSTYEAWLRDVRVVESFSKIDEIGSSKYGDLAHIPDVLNRASSEDIDRIVYLYDDSTHDRHRLYESAAAAILGASCVNSGLFRACWAKGAGVDGPAVCRTGSKFLSRTHPQLHAFPLVPEWLWRNVRIEPVDPVGNDFADIVHQIYAFACKYYSVAEPGDEIINPDVTYVLEG